MLMEIMKCIAIYNLRSYVGYNKDRRENNTIKTALTFRMWIWVKILLIKDEPLMKKINTPIGY